MRVAVGMLVLVLLERVNERSQVVYCDRVVVDEERHGDRHVRELRHASPAFVDAIVDGVPPLGGCLSEVVNASRIEEVAACLGDESSRPVCFARGDDATNRTCVASGVSCVHEVGAGAHVGERRPRLRYNPLAVLDVDDDRCRAFSDLIRKLEHVVVCEV